MGSKITDRKLDGDVSAGVRIRGFRSNIPYLPSWEVILGAACRSARSAWALSQSGGCSAEDAYP